MNGLVLFEGAMVIAGNQEIVIRDTPAVGLKVLNADLVDILDEFLAQVKQYQYGTVTITMEKGRVSRMAWSPTVKLRTSLILTDR